jgi:hypothetical protein
LVWKPPGCSQTEAALLTITGHDGEKGNAALAPLSKGRRRRRYLLNAHHIPTQLSARSRTQCL